MLANERRKTEAKFAGFEDFKAKAEQFDAAQEAQKSDLQKAQDALAAVTAERDSLKSAQERAKWVGEVAEETKLPASTVSMLSGKDKEELMEQAKKLAPDFAEPVRGEGGKPAKTGPGSTGEFVSQLFGR